MTSPDLTDANIEKLAELFPTVITESIDADGNVRMAVDFDLLRQELSDHLVEGPQERYRLDWPGKRAAAFAANAPVAKTLRPVREESVDFDTTRNLFIEGDNLDALKLLQESYLSKVKLIYIDPPYNTGNDFVYNDDFAETTGDYLARSGQEDEDGARLVANSESNGRFHSDWSSMMLPRLKLARRLLREDGVILISIDDNEVHGLRHLCDEVFGSANFIAQMVWQRSRKGDSKLVAKVHEYVLCYVRDKATTTAAGVWRKEKEGVAEVLAHYERLRDDLGSDHDGIRTAMQEWYRGLSKADPRRAHAHYNWSDDRGLYFAADFAGPDDGRKSRPRHDILHPVTGLPCKKPSTGWRWDAEKTAWALAQDPPRIHFGRDDSTIPNRKSYLSDITSEPFSSVFYRDGRSATLEVEGLVGKGWFQFPKNTDVLEELIELTTGPSDVILDFFAGSGSTGHAVMKLNARMGSTRSFILVQLAEATGRAEFPTIAHISRERIRRAGVRIAEEAGFGADRQDTGFRSLSVDTTNMTDVLRRPDETDQLALDQLEGSVKSDRSGLDLLFQVLLDWGIELSIPVSVEQIEGHQVFSVEDGALIACFEEMVRPEVISAIAQRQPLRAVFRDSGFGSDDARINAEQVFREVSPATDVKAI